MLLFSGEKEKRAVLIRNEDVLFFGRIHFSGCQQEMSMSGIQFKMQQRLIRKFMKAGATSKEKAVTVEEAKLDEQETYWLDYFAGVFLGKIKRTEDHRYYV